MPTAAVAYEELAERKTAHLFFIAYWRRSERREALIWAKDEKSAVGLLVSAVPEADIAAVEEREADGMRPGKNVYAVGEAREGDPYEDDVVLRAVKRDASSSPGGLASVPRIVRSLDGRIPPRITLKILERLAREQLIELRPESGVELLSPEDLALTVPGPRGSVLSYARPLDGARDYVAVDSRGKQVFGPTKDYGAARKHADESGGVVHFVMGASDCVGIHTHGAAEGPHSLPAAPKAQHCSKDSAIRIAGQVPGGPWAYVKLYPKEAQARIERQQDFLIDGHTVTAYFCGRHLLLRCPTSGTQYLFESACVGDVPDKGPAAPPQGVQPEKSKPFVVKLKRDGKTITEEGPFATPTDAYNAIEKAKGSQKGDLAGIFRDGKLIEFRGGKAAWTFGRTRWSRA